MGLILYIVYIYCIGANILENKGREARAGIEVHLTAVKHVVAGSGYVGLGPWTGYNYTASSSQVHIRHAGTCMHTYSAE